MKKLIILLLVIQQLSAVAQKVGVNTNTPQTSLDVRGTERIGGANSYTLFDSATGRIQWVGASLFAPVSQQFIKHSASSEGMYAGGGKLEYRNDVGSTVFYSDWTTGNGFFSGKVGIGLLPATEKLEVAGNIKASNLIYTTAKTKHYTLSGIDFVPEVSTDTFAIGLGTGSVAMSSSIPGRRMIASLHLPEGATIVKMTPWISDGSADNLQIIFYRKNLADNFFAENLGNVSSAGSAGVATAYPQFLFNAVIDNTQYTYYISAGIENFSHSWAGSPYLYAVIVEYTMPSPL